MSAMMMSGGMTRAVICIGGSSSVRIHRRRKLHPVAASSLRAKPGPPLPGQPLVQCFHLVEAETIPAFAIICPAPDADPCSTRTRRRPVRALADADSFHSADPQPCPVSRLEIGSTQADDAPILRFLVVGPRNASRNRHHPNPLAEPNGQHGWAGVPGLFVSRGCGRARGRRDRNSLPAVLPAGEGAGC